MTRLAISLLGPTQFVLDGAPIASFPYDKVRALLARLVAEPDRAQRRESLAGLLWPEQDERAARHSLSQAVWSLRRALAADGDVPILLVTRDAIGLSPEAGVQVDVAELDALLGAVDAHPHVTGVICRQCAGRLAAATRLYRGPFLEDLSLPDSAEFAEWTLVRREQIAARVARALNSLAAYHQARGEHDRAAEAGGRLVRLDPYDEGTRRRLMQALAAAGQRSAALAQYEECRQLLADELGVEPDDATASLYQQIRDDSRPSFAGMDPARRPPSGLPLDVTPFVGREAELRRIAALLDEPACRLVTLVGPGGIGKTRLAVRAAAAAGGAFRDGVRFIALAGVAEPGLLPVVIADALDIRLARAPSPAEQVAGALREREVLLVLDNVEQLVAGVTFLADLLDRAPDVQLIVTSRERLDLRGEWVVEVGGLELPGPEIPAARSSAVQLFAHSARRVWPDFELGPETLEDVVRVCRLTGAMPLGIELAAAWLPTLSCAEIAVEIERSLDFLAAATRDAPERHRSIRVVFDRSWERLTDDERRVFSRLAVFRGGVSRAAAEAVGGGSLPVLSALVAKSLARRDASGRFEVHELLRQYAAARLAERPAEAEDTRDRHCAWFCDLLARRRAELSGTGQQRALEEIGSDHENVRAAWAWAIERRRVADILKAVHGYWLYAEVTGRYLETQEILGQVIEVLSAEPHGAAGGRHERELALGATLIRYGSIHERLGDYAAGERAIDAGIAVLRPLGEPFDLGLALNFNAMFAHARREYRQQHDLLMESIEQFVAAGDRWGQGYSLNDLGLATLMLGDPGEARGLQERALAIFTEIGDRRGAGFVLHNLGVAALALGELDEARRRLCEALAIRRGLRHSWGIATTLTTLGAVDLAAGRAGTAGECLREALRQAVVAQSLPAALGASVELAAVWMASGEHGLDRAARVLALARGHPALDAATRDRVDRLLSELGPPLDTTPVVHDWVTQPVAEQVRVMLGDEAELALA